MGNSGPSKTNLKWPDRGRGEHDWRLGFSVKHSGSICGSSEHMAKEEKEGGTRGVLRNLVGRGEIPILIFQITLFPFSTLFSPFFLPLIPPMLQNFGRGNLPKFWDGGLKALFLSPWIRPLGDGRGPVMKVVWLGLVWAGFISSLSSPVRGVACV